METDQLGSGALLNHYLHRLRLCILICRMGGCTPEQDHEDEGRELCKGLLTTLHEEQELSPRAMS